MKPIILNLFSSLLGRKICARTIVINGTNAINSPAMPDVINDLALGYKLKGNDITNDCIYKKIYPCREVFGNFFLHIRQEKIKTTEPIANRYPTVCSGEKNPPFKHSYIIANDDPQIIISNPRY